MAPLQAAAAEVVVSAAAGAFQAYLSGMAAVETATIEIAAGRRGAHPCGPSHKNQFANRSNLAKPI
jgi:hypothetical protein